ncbi:MAG: hypothetical protein COA78_02495 [Blastopirellula sp.]|nr:MAG: hypothetical protein COA78_02495 [Blastopirellula sp.]
MSADLPEEAAAFDVASAMHSHGQGMSGKRVIPAWALSLLLHTSLVIVLALTVQEVNRDAPGDEPDRSGSIVLASHENGETEYFDGSRNNSTSKAEQTDSTDPSEAIESSVPAIDDVPFDVGSLLASDGGEPLNGNEIGKGLPGIGELGTGGENKRPGAGEKGTTSVFGAEGTGSKFVYVFDRSGSMNGWGGRPLAAAKSELIASLGELEETHQFSIVFYNENQRIFDTGDGRGKLVFANTQGKILAERFVKSVTANGGTQHLPALLLALNMQPDVIFFLTDAAQPEMFPSELERVRRRNKGTVIHTIEFGDIPFSGKRNFLVKLAEQNAGRHIYIDISK